MVGAYVVVQSPAPFASSPGVDLPGIYFFFYFFSNRATGHQFLLAGSVDPTMLCTDSDKQLISQLTPGSTLRTKIHKESIRHFRSK
jgi:hypothetical protein